MSNKKLGKKRNRKEKKLDKLKGGKKKKTSVQARTFLMYNGGGGLPFGEKIVIQYLPTDSFALFKTKKILDKKARISGIQINISEPIQQKETFFEDFTQDNAVMVNLGADEIGNYDIRLELHPSTISQFGLEKENINTIKSELDGNLLRLFLATPLEIRPPPPPNTICLIGDKILFSSTFMEEINRGVQPKNRLNAHHIIDTKVELINVKVELDV